jgi:hypothetical protein
MPDAEWLNAVFAKPPVTVDLWHDPQSPVTGKWFAGLVTIVTPKKERPVAWQVAQAVPLTALWFIGVPANDEAAVGHLWQLPHVVNVVGMWLDGLPTAVLLSWQPADAHVVLDVNEL